MLELRNYDPMDKFLKYNPLIHKGIEKYFQPLPPFPTHISSQLKITTKIQNHMFQVSKNFKQGLNQVSFGV